MSGHLLLKHSRDPSVSSCVPKLQAGNWQVEEAVQACETDLKHKSLIGHHQHSRRCKRKKTPNLEYFLTKKITMMSSLNIFTILQPKNQLRSFLQCIHQAFLNKAIKSQHKNKVCFQENSPILQQSSCCKSLL